MRRLLMKYSILAAALLTLSVPVLAADETMGSRAMGSDSQKDECLLVAKNCSGEVDSIIQRINRLNTEIAKGSAVYSRDELAILNGKLHDATEMLNGLISGS